MMATPEVDPQQVPSAGRYRQDELSATRVFDRRSNPEEPVTRGDMGKLIGKLNERFDAQDHAIDENAATLKRVHDALFYVPTDADDEQPPGIMPVMRKIDKHVDVICGMAKWAWRAGVAFVGVACPVIGIYGQFKGWW